MCPEFCLEKMMQKHIVREIEDKVRTALGQIAVKSVAVRTTGHTLRGDCPVPVTCPEVSIDYSLLSEKQFLTMLNEIHCLEELAGLGNRRRILNTPSLPRWNEVQRGLIVQRKFELENMKGKKK